MLTVYTIKNCSECKRTLEHLQRENIAHKVISVCDEETCQLLIQHGFWSFPVVTYNQSFDFAWCGYREDRLKDPF